MPVPGPVTPAGFLVNSWSARTGQRVLARLVDSAIALGVVAAVVVGGPHGRPLAQDVLIVGFVATLEVAMLVRTGATIGMSTVGIRVASLDRSGPPDRTAAIRRTVPVAVCYAVLPPGPVVVLVASVALLVSIAWSPDRRGFHDRASATVVVQAGAPDPVTTAELARWWGPGHGHVMSRWGRVPDLFERRRARAHRVDDVAGLAAVIAIAGIVLIGFGGTVWWWVGLTATWVVVLVVDETRRVAGNGANPGHERFGFRVVDLATGERPGTARSLLRAVVVVPLVCIPPLQVILAVWVRWSAVNRGPHDLLARTVVVDPTFRPPRFHPSATPVPTGRTHVAAPPGGPGTHRSVPPPPPPPPYPIPGPF